MSPGPLLERRDPDINLCDANGTEWQDADVVPRSDRALIRHRCARVRRNGLDSFRNDLISRIEHAAKVSKRAKQRVALRSDILLDRLNDP